MDFILLLVLLLIINQIIVGSLIRKYAFLSKKILNGLFFYHLLFLGVYYTYAQFNSSDSLEYFKSAQAIGNDWHFFTYTGTKFIDNFAAFFVQIKSLNLLFTYLGMQKVGQGEKIP